MSGFASKPEKEDQELTSWKEIAGYLGKSVRTVQNWKNDYGLPVRPGVTPRSVIASTRELDNWKRVRPAEVSPKRRPASMRWAAIAACAVLGAGMSFYALRSDQKPAFFRIENNKFIVLDSKSRELWTLHYPADLAKTGVFYAHGAQAAIADLDNDGSPEVLVLPHLSESLARDLLCYSADGKLRWKYTQDRAVRTSESEYSPLYKFNSFVVIPPDESGNRRVAVSAVHELYWPSAVTLLRSDGKAVRQYWHGGHLGALAIDGTRLFAGGTRNYTGESVLVVLDIDSMSGASHEDAAHQLLDLGPERVQQRISFSRSCLSLHSAALGAVNRIDLRPGEILAHTMESTEPPLATLTWSFTRDLAFNSVTESSLYTKEKATADPKCLASEKLKPRVIAGL